jgi:PRTRC genetic system protein E
MFFQKLSEIIDGVDINLSIHKKDGELTVLVVPVTDKPVEKTSKTDKENKPKVSKPMSIKGSPEELDKEFFSSIGEALKETSGLVAKTRAYKEELKKKTEELENKVSSKRPVTKSKSNDEENDTGEDLFNSNEEPENTDENTDENNEENKADESEEE